MNWRQAPTSYSWNSAEGEERSFSFSDSTSSRLRDAKSLNINKTAWDMRWMVKKTHSPELFPGLQGLQPLQRWWLCLLPGSCNCHRASGWGWFWYLQKDNSKWITHPALADRNMLLDYWLEIITLLVVSGVCVCVCVHQWLSLSGKLHHSRCSITSGFRAMGDWHRLYCLMVQ